MSSGTLSGKRIGLEETHKRRKRYSGTHPKHFDEKYKEHNPDKYTETIKKVIQKGSTPAGMHISICVNEILDFLQIHTGQIGIDCTLGYGGHTSAMLGKLEGRGHIYGLDVDPIEIEKTRKRLLDKGYGPEILTIRQMNFANIAKIGAEVGGFDFALADLGVSSMQIDNPERGFSYKREGPLDLRLDPSNGISAAERMRDITEEELTGMLIENSDEPYAAEIASTFIRKRKRGFRLEKTTELEEVIEEALDFVDASERKEAIKKSCQRTFQALRIDVNNEFEVLYNFLEDLPSALKSGGRVAILTFHSGEERLVKRAFKEGLQNGVYREISKQVIRPSAAECAENSRARSTKMRWAIKA